MISASDRLKNERKRLNKTQEYVATACEIAVQSLRNYESGKRKPDIDFLKGIAAIGADVQYIITGERKMPDASAFDPEVIEIIERYNVLSDEDKGHIRGILASLVKANSDKKIE
ncbi:MAG: helix-turn-helix transcriptional regulator [Candidatus Pacearchaeota archaeon]|nr:helix-turn-helix transcriptional regulator [Candidatus Pacearchaeota archaeon]